MLLSILCDISGQITSPPSSLTKPDPIPANSIFAPTFSKIRRLSSASFHLSPYLSPKPLNMRSRRCRCFAQRKYRVVFFVLPDRENAQHLGGGWKVSLFLISGQNQHSNATSDSTWCTPSTLPLNSYQTLRYPIPPSCFCNLY